MLEGASADRSERGKGKNKAGYFPVSEPVENLGHHAGVTTVRSKAIEDGMRRLGPNSALVMYISTEMDP